MSIVITVLVQDVVQRLLSTFQELVMVPGYPYKHQAPLECRVPEVQAVSYSSEEDQQADKGQLVTSPTSYTEAAICALLKETQLAQPIDDGQISSPAQQAPQSQRDCVDTTSQFQDVLNTVPTSQELSTQEGGIARSSIAWNSLTLEVKQKCRGCECPTLRLGKNAWFITGPLLEYYSKTLEPLVKRIVGNNHTKIFKNSRSGLNFSPLLLGPSDDIDEAQPTILLLTEDFKLGLRAQDIILRSSQYSRRSHGFKVEVDMRSIIHASLESASARLGRPDGNEARNLCSRLAFVQKLSPLGEGSADAAPWTCTTIGGVLLIGGQHFAMTVAHCLLNFDTVQMSGHTDHSSQVDSLEHMHDNEPEHASKDNFPDVSSVDETQDDEQPRNRDRFGQTVSGNFAFYLDGTNAALSPSATTSLSFSLPVQRGPLRSHLLGHIRQDNPSKSIYILGQLVSLEFDWALIPINDQSLKRSNQFLVPELGLTTIRHVKTNNQGCIKKLYMKTQRSGIKEVSILETHACYTFPWSRQVHRIFTVNVTVERGDSGSWIFDSSGTLHGIVVATVPSLSITYALYAEDVLSHIASHVSGDVGLEMDHMLPQTQEVTVDQNPVSSMFEVDSSSGMRRPSDTKIHVKLKSTSRKDRLSSTDQGTTLPDSRSVSKYLRLNSPVPLVSLHVSLLIILFIFALSAGFSALPSLVSPTTYRINQIGNTDLDIVRHALCAIILLSISSISFDIFSLNTSCLIHFTVFAVGCGRCSLAITINEFIIGRTIAGIGSRGLITEILLRSMDIAQKLDLLVFVLALVSIVLGHLSGPSIAGFLIRHMSWSRCFWMSALAELIAFLVSVNQVDQVIISKSVKATSRRPVDGLAQRLIFDSRVVHTYGLLLTYYPLPNYPPTSERTQVLATLATFILPLAIFALDLSTGLSILIKKRQGRGENGMSERCSSVLNVEYRQCVRSER